MATAADRLKAKPKTNSGESKATVAGLEIRVSPPEVKVASPQVRVDSPVNATVNADMREVAEAIDHMAQAFNQTLQGLAQAMQRQNEQMAQISARQEAILSALSSQKPPVVQMGAKTRGFDVELVKDGDETVGMRIEPRQRGRR